MENVRRVFRQRERSTEGTTQGEESHGRDETPARLAMKEKNE
jgi:hypothetical protein